MSSTSVAAGNWLQVQPIDEEDDCVPLVNTLATCMTLSDLKSDDYIRLVVADVRLADDDEDDDEANNRNLNRNTGNDEDDTFNVGSWATAVLKEFNGTTLEASHKLPGIPSALESLYVDESMPRTPIIAVAIGESVLFFRHFKPYFKYTLPDMPVDENERELWRKLTTVRVDQQAALIENLRSMDRALLTRNSQRLLQLPAHEQNDFIRSNAETPLTRYATIVAMRCLARVSSCAIPPSHLVLVTDDGHILILEAQSFGVLYEATTCAYPCTPSLLAVHGTYETDFRLVIATRCGGVYLLRGKSVSEGQEIFKMAQPLTGLLLLPVDQTIVVTTMDRRLVCYSKKGKQLWGMPLGAVPICLITATVSHLGLTLICVALEGGLVQFYWQKQLVDEFRMQSSVVAMHFGRLGYEEHVLVVVTVEQQTYVKILRRLAVFEASRMRALKQPDEQRRPAVALSILDKPKKSSIFVEQVSREKHNAKATYGSFQVELWRLRHAAARATVEAINSSESTISGDITHAPVKLSAEVCGAGPVFRLYLTIQNLSTYKMASNLWVLLHADRRHYTLPKSVAKLPSILPGIPLKIDFEVTAILDPMNKLPPHTLTPDNSHIRVMLVKAKHAKPLIAAVIAMPQSEANFA